MESQSPVFGHKAKSYFDRFKCAVHTANTYRNNMVELMKCKGESYKWWRQLGFKNNIQ